MSRRRPTSVEERNAARLRQVSTGRGQPNAGPVRAFPTKTVRAAAAGAAFTQRYVSLTRVTTQTFGDEVSITFTAETTHGSPIDFRGSNAVPTALPNVSITQPYVVYVLVRVSSDPVDLHVELRGNFPAVAGQFDHTGSGVWTAQFSAVVVPDVSALRTLSVVGQGVGSNVTCTRAELWIYPLR